jgi:hypothetical protein
MSCGRDGGSAASAHDFTNGAYLPRQSVSIESLFEAVALGLSINHTPRTSVMRERYMQPKANRVDRALFERPAAKSTGENSCGVDISEVVGSCGKITLSATFPQVR